MKLKKVLSEVFFAISNNSGKHVVFKDKEARDAAVKAGTHSMDDEYENGSDTPKDKPKVNIFDKPKKDKEEPKSQSSDSDSDDEFEFLDSFEMEEKLDSMDLSDDVRAELDRQIDYLQGQEYELENAREEGDDEAEAEIEDDIARTRDEIGKIFKSAKKNPTHEKLKEHKNTPIKLKKVLSEVAGTPLMKVISNPYAKAFAQVNEAEDDKYTHIGYGKYKEKGKEDNPDAPTFTKTDSGKYVPTSGGDSKPKDTKGGVNIFDKDYDAGEEPKKDGPVKDSSGGRAGNPQVNKATKAKAEEFGITPNELGREEYEKTMIQAAVAALTDANYHTEARQLIAMIEDKPEWNEDPRKSAPSIDSPEYDEWRKSSVYSSDYYDADSATEEFGQYVAQEAGWNGVDALDGIAFELKTRGFVDLATKMQSVIKENKSTKLKTLIKK